MKAVAAQRLHWTATTLFTLTYQSQKKRIHMSSIQTTARVTGVLMLLMVILAPFSMIYVPKVKLVRNQ